MKRILANPIFLIAVLFFISACSDFLDIEPQGRVNESALATREGVESLLIGAYAMLDGISNGFGNPGAASLFNSAASNWVYGSIAGTDAHKGSDPTDYSTINSIEQYNTLPTNEMFNDRWRAIYEGVARANSVLIVLPQVTAATAEDTIRVRAEARVLRGIYHFEALKLWNSVPYINEYVDPNSARNDKEIWPQVVEDLKSGYDKLPEQMDAIGRINKWVAAAFYAKALLFQGKYSDAYPILNEIFSNGKNPLGLKYALMPSFSDNFNVETENNSESVFAFQYSVNDGSDGHNSAFGEAFNFPYGQGPVGCCGFFQPSSELVNSYRTGPAGLPLLDGSYNQNGTTIKDDDGVESEDPFTEDTGNLDPRLDWTVGRRGIPYHDWGIHPGKVWIRDQTYGGPYSPKKNMYRKSQSEEYVDQSWPGGPLNASNYSMIRFADIILWLAECEVEVGSIDKAREYVNMIRARAANPGGFVKEADGNTPSANYVVGLYSAGYPFDNRENARKAVHFERKLELAMEGHRFFDLVRWGEAASTIEAYLNYEKPKRAESLKGAKFDAGVDEYYPIPQRQIDLMGKTILVQNNGY